MILLLEKLTRKTVLQGELNPVNAKLLAVRRWQFSFLDQDAMGHSPSSFDILPAIVDLVEFELHLWEQQGYGRGQVERVSAGFAPVELPLDIDEKPFCGYCFGGAQAIIHHCIAFYRKSQELAVSTNTLLILISAARSRRGPLGFLSSVTRGVSRC